VRRIETEGKTGVGNTCGGEAIKKKELPPDGGERRKQQMRYEESEGPV
jgi:hypothetical protein